MTSANRPGEAGLLAYLREALFFRWNLLLLAGAAGVAVLSPTPDVLLPVVLAAELAYLTGLVSIPRFRAAIDAKVYAGASGWLGRGAVAGQRSLDSMLAGLDAAGRERFDTLRRRCIHMRGIAQGVRGGTDAAAHADDLRTPALDRLLWVFLRLLYSEQALKRFVATTDRHDIAVRLADLEARERAARERQDERILRSLRDSIATAELRLANCEKAESNLEFVHVELERIEGKIQALVETAVSHQDPNYISSQVDSVTESMVHTEAAIRELNHITGLSDELHAPPPILDVERVHS